LLESRLLLYGPTDVLMFHNDLSGTAATLNELQDELVADLPLERDAGKPVGRLVEAFGGRLEAVGLLAIGQELGLQRQLHASLIVRTALSIKGGGGGSPVA
jgi:hypothetical protein